jgi:hypothetical protein
MENRLNQYFLEPGPIQVTGSAYHLSHLTLAELLMWAGSAAITLGWPLCKPQMNHP